MNEFNTWNYQMILRVASGFVISLRPDVPFASSTPCIPVSPFMTQMEPPSHDPATLSGSLQAW